MVVVGPTCVWWLVCQSFWPMHEATVTRSHINCMHNIGKEAQKGAHFGNPLCAGQWQTPPGKSRLVLHFGINAPWPITSAVSQPMLPPGFAPTVQSNDHRTGISVVASAHAA